MREKIRDEDSFCTEMEVPCFTLNIKSFSKHRVQTEHHVFARGKFC